MDRWWTNEEGRTGADGTFACRGFLGDYELTVTAGGKMLTVPLTLMAATERVVSLEP